MPSAVFVPPIEPPVSTVMLWLESSVTRLPVSTLSAPPLAIRMESAPVPVAFDVWIGVVRVVEITISA